MKPFFFFASLLYLLVFSCTKEDGLGGENCPLIYPSCDTSLFTRLSTIDTCWMLPEFGASYVFYRLKPSIFPVGKSPANTHMFIYQRYTSGRTSELWAIDTCENTRNMLAPALDGASIANNQDWVLFKDANDFNLYKVKTNGDSLSLVSEKITHYYFDWCMGGEYFVSKDLWKDTTFLYSKTGAILDTFLLGYRTLAARGHQLAVSIGEHSDTLAILNLQNKELTKVFSVPPGLGNVSYHPLTQLEWQGPSHVIWVNPSGIFRIDISNGTMAQLKESCDNAAYGVPVITEEAQPWMFLGRIDRDYPETPGVVHFVTSLIAFNTNTGAEWIIDIEP